jgi:hypothetical protein
MNEPASAMDSSIAGTTTSTSATSTGAKTTIAIGMIVEMITNSHTIKNVAIGIYYYSSHFLSREITS